MIQIIFRVLTVFACFRSERITGYIREDATQKLFSRDGFEGDGFGYDVDTTNEFMVVGCPNDHVNGTRDAGSVLIYKFNHDKIDQEVKLTPPVNSSDRFFGRSVAVSGNRVIIGSRYFNKSGQPTGAAYVYKHTRDTTAWGLEGVLVPHDGIAHDGFGYDVDIYQDVAVVSSIKDDDQGWNSGSVYVFVHTGSGWVEETKLKSNDSRAWDFFGYSVSIYNRFIVVGAITHDSNEVKNSGAVYLFTKDEQDSKWRISTKLEPPEPQTQGFFGGSVDIYASRIAVGAHGEDKNTGFVYIYKKNKDTWTYDGRLSASDKSYGHHFGWSVATDGKSVVVGSPDISESGEERSDSGSTYIYLTSKELPEEKKLLCDNAADRWFGRSVAVNGDKVVAGSFSDRLKNNGSVYVYYVITVEPTISVGLILGILIPIIIIVVAVCLLFKYKLKNTNVGGKNTNVRGKNQNQTRTTNVIQKTTLPTEEHMLNPMPVGNMY